MRFEVNGSLVFASTGGRDHIRGQPWIVFIHGAGQNHVCWSQQVRAFSYDGFNVLALDLPGHGASEGDVLTSVEEMSAWLGDVFDKLQIPSAHLVSHSMGGLISLELASRYKDRATSCVFIATGMRIGVGEALIKWAKTDQERAITTMMSLAHGGYGHRYDSSVPGTSLIGSSIRTMQSNDEHALAADIVACNSYNGGAKAAAMIDCPTYCMVSQVDRMVNASVELELYNALSDNRLFEFAQAGHMIPSERARELNQLVREFYSEIIPVS